MRRAQIRSTDCHEEPFFEAGVIASLRYRVTCDRSWNAQRGHVVGWAGDQAIDWKIGQNRDGVWTLNEREYPELNECHDLDLGFTPATNLLQIRRIALATGAGVDVPVAWLDAASTKLALLPQRYARIEGHRYDYASPTVNYHAVLDVTPSGFVRTYPGLWAFECSSEGYPPPGGN